MNAHDAIARRIAFWSAMLTGLVLVGLQFGCLRSQTILAAPGFTRASRRIDPQADATLNANVSTPAQTKETAASLYWTSPQTNARPITRVAFIKAPPDASLTPGKGEPISPTARGAVQPRFPDLIEGTE